MAFSKWRDVNGEIFPSPDVFDHLPAGLYEVDTTYYGDVFLKRIETRTDALHLLKMSSMDDVISELKNFWEKESEYRKYHLVYKRGVLLHGPAGTGKTSLINLLLREAEENLDAICFMFEDSGVIKEAIEIVREIHPRRRIIVFIEDIDQHSNNTELLSMLDGAYAQDNIVYVATTNFPEKLTQRIQNRPSRFDRKIEIGFPSLEMRLEYLRLISHGEDYTEWAEKTEGFSFAHLKELFVAVKILECDVDETIEKLCDMKIVSTSATYDDSEDCILDKLMEGVSKKKKKKK